MSFRKRLICEHAAARITRETGVRVTFAPFAHAYGARYRVADRAVRYARDAERVAHNIARGA